MMTSNNALVPDPDKEDILASKPFDWPWLYLGLRMCGWAAEQSKYYLIGNPIVWYSVSGYLFFRRGGEGEEKSVFTDSWISSVSPLCFFLSVYDLSRALVSS
jgi:hypothetical protein